MLVSDIGQTRLFTAKLRVIGIVIRIQAGILTTEEDIITVIAFNHIITTETIQVIMALTTDDGIDIT